MDSRFKLLVDTFGKDKFKFNEPLAPFTTLKIGGPAKLFFIVFSINEIIKLVNFCRQLKLPFLLFGTGSKVLISDKGFEGLVIKNRTRNLKVLSIKGKVSKTGIGVEEALIEAESGVSMINFADFLRGQGLAYKEFEDTAGSIGGNLFLNFNLQEKTENIKVLNMDLKVVTISIRDLNLNKYIILSATFKIKAKI